jgi:hypothetical protein
MQLLILLLVFAPNPWHSRSCRKAIFHHSSPKQNNAEQQPATTSSSSRHSKERSRDINNSLATGGSPVKAAPSKAQAATLAAYNPEPHRASEARGFVGQNPAQQVPDSNAMATKQQQQQQVPRQSPGLAAGMGGGAGNFEDARAKAEKMVNAEREARGRMPVYEGLPSQFQLELKMGEYVRLRQLLHVRATSD